LARTHFSTVPYKASDFVRSNGAAEWCDRVGLAANASNNAHNMPEPWLEQCALTEFLRFERLRSAPVRRCDLPLQGSGKDRCYNGRPYLCT